MNQIEWVEFHLDSIPITCLHVNHSYLEFSGTIMHFLKSLLCLKLNDEPQERKGTRKDSGEGGPPAFPGKAPGLQKQRRLVSMQEATHPHLYSSRHIFIPISHTSFLSTSPTVASAGPDQASVLIWLNIIHEEGICAPVCTHTLVLSPKGCAGHRE